MPDGTGPAPHEPALGPRVAKLSKDMLSFQDKLMEISIIDTEGRPILAGDEERRFLKVLGCINTRGNTTSVILQGTHIKSSTPLETIRWDHLRFKAHF